MGKYDSANNCDLTICITLAEYRDLIQGAEWRRNRISELEARVEALTKDNRRLMGIDNESLGITINDNAKRAFDGLVVE